MEKFNLKWTDFQTTISNSFKILKEEKEFLDVTLVAEDQKQIQSHKVVLSACSSFFKAILQNNTHSHPLIYLSGINSTNLQYLIDYVYEGEIQIHQGELDSFLDSARKLQIAGLLSDQKDEIANDNIVTLKSEVNVGEVLEEDINEFEISGVQNQKRTLRNKTVAVNGHDQNEVNRTINETFIKQNDKFKCTVCGKMSKDRRNMRRHVEVHIEGLSYECQFCTNTFRYKQ